MRAIVDGVASDDEVDRWHVNARCVIGVGVSNVHGDNRVAFNVEAAVIQCFGSDKLIRDLSWKPSLPVFDGIGGEGFVHSLDYVISYGLTSKQRAPKNFTTRCSLSTPTALISDRFGGALTPQRPLGSQRRNLNRNRNF